MASQNRSTKLTDALLASFEVRMDQASFTWLLFEMLPAVEGVASPQVVASTAAAAAQQWLRLEHFTASRIGFRGVLERSGHSD